VVFSFLGIFVASAGYKIYGVAIWNPVDLIAKINSPPLTIISFFVISIATIRYTISLLLCN
jgi:cytosine/uracil/thiamine/allantoin permease